MPAAASVRLHSVAVAADLLGGMSQRFVWQLIADGVLSRVKIGRRTLVRDDELAAFIDANTLAS